ncbi:septum site-determining protein MinC [Swingsia samuiensis]|uniref:Probable septum site-determining protein MinC n=1 Tax=Swingsia samuiensis TaxID=1293412 RepID=A0A4Y6UI66_9PROT|nr:septum site-determining protein MinC [Swingsia samuiensis]QDH16500.1 septum formation inhibitor MinC [Swingsia samuiensis]
MSNTAPSPVSPTPMRIRARGRSFLALVLSPEPPLQDWLAGLDAQIKRSSELFRGKPIILDLSLLAHDTPDLAALYENLVTRGVRIIGIEGGDRTWDAVSSWDWPDSFAGGKPSGEIELPDQDTTSDSSKSPPSTSLGEPLIIETAIRSGQRFQNLHGDIIVLGSVSSGAELIAGGSIHIYGALRGRALAGISSKNARIFATRMEAELLALDGYYAVSEDIDPSIIGKSAQVLLQDDQVVVFPLPR